MERFRQAVLAGGSGAVGRLFAELLLAAGTEVTCVDQVEPGYPATRWLPADIRTPDGALASALSTCDMVLLAVPEPVVLDAVGPLGALLPDGALFVDTTSVKSRVVPAVAARVTGAAVSLNPMFAPALGFAGRVVAAVAVRTGPAVAVLHGLMTGAGARVVELDAQRHDRVTAVSQAATHAAVLAFGVAAEQLGVDVATLLALAPPPHRTLLAMVARIASGAPETYWDIQEANPFAGTARAALLDGVREVDAVDGSDEFAALLARLRDFLGPARIGLAEQCADIFATVGVPPPVG